MSDQRKNLTDKTLCTVAGRKPCLHGKVVNQPVYRASTVVFDTLEEYYASQKILPGDGITYGVHGTHATYAFEKSIAQLEGGYRTRLCSSGLVACTAALLCYLNAGDHLLMTDSVYGPTRTFCHSTLKRLGIKTTFYDPAIGEGIEALIQPNTRVVFTESPGSWTFEVQDIPAICHIAKKHGCITIIDNTWASPLYFKPFQHGVDVSIQAITKYVGGHSDLLMGTVTTTKEVYPILRNGWRDLGLCVSGDDVFMAARGLRTLSTRLTAHAKSALYVAEWLQRRPEVIQVLYPALHGDQGHELWQRDFSGASSLFGFVLKPAYSNNEQLAKLMDNLKLFAMGFSWGGYESLLIPVNPASIRNFWPRSNIPSGQLMRIHVGLEDVNDLLDDLEQGFKNLHS